MISIMIAALEEMVIRTTSQPLGSCPFEIGMKILKTAFFEIVVKDSYLETDIYGLEIMSPLTFRHDGHMTLFIMISASTSSLLIFTLVILTSYT